MDEKELKALFTDEAIKEIMRITRMVVEARKTKTKINNKNQNNNKKQQL